MTLIGALATLGATAATIIAAKRSQRRQNKANKQMAEYQNALNQKAWQEQQDYNTPAAQMQRLKDAGLNPNLIYSQGTTGNADSQPSYVAPEQQYNNLVGQSIQSGLGQYYSALSQYQAMEMTDEQIRAQRLANERAELEMPYLQNGYYLKYHGLELKNQAQEINNELLQQRYREVEERIQGIKIHNELSEKQMEILDQKLVEFNLRFRAMDDQHQASLFSTALQEIDYATKYDQYRFGMELQRIQGRVLSAKSIDDLNWTDLLKLGIYYMGGIFKLPIGGSTKLRKPSDIRVQLKDGLKVSNKGNRVINKDGEIEYKKRKTYQRFRLDVNK